jgi:hypothetical protein
MGEKHVKNRQLNDCLIGTCAHTIQDHGSKPLTSSMKLAQENTCTHTDGGGTEKDGPAPDLHGCGNPEDVDESL